MINLVLLTATLRKGNLPRIARSIVSSFSPVWDQFNLTWLICVDKYNSYGDHGDVIEYCEQNGLHCEVHLSGKPDQKNYGGDIFNPVILPYLATYKSDPWIYVLDDDNIIHPFIPYTIIKCEQLSKEGNKKNIIWMSKLRETGVTDQAPYCMAMHPFPLDQGQYFIPAQLCPDPSQLVIKGHIIKECNGYGSGFTYDFGWCLPLCQARKDDVYFFNEYNTTSIDIIHCYHNGLRSIKEFNTDMGLLLSKPTETHFYVGSMEESDVPHIYPVSKELALKIMNLIKSEQGF